MIHSTSPVPAFSAESSQSTFNFGGHPIRVIVRDGDPWFVATDVCSALGYSNTSKAVGDHLDPDEKGVTTGYTLGGEQRLTIISESGLYALVLRSRKPEARKFAKWVTGEVLPSIRKTGGYAKPTHDPQRSEHAMNLATEAGQQVTKAVYAALMAGQPLESLTSQWMLYFHRDSRGMNAHCQPLSIDAICLGPDAYIDSLESHDGHSLTTEQVARMAEFSTRDLTRRARVQSSKSRALAA